LVAFSRALLAGGVGGNMRMSINVNGMEVNGMNGLDGLNGLDMVGLLLVHLVAENFCSQTTHTAVQVESSGPP
jgi:hypothetical protein